MFGVAPWPTRQVPRPGHPVLHDEATIDAVGPELVVFAVAEGTSLGQHARAMRALAKRVPVAVGGAGITQDEARRLAARFLG